MNQRVVDVAVTLEVPIKDFSKDRVQYGVGDDIGRVKKSLCVVQ